ncbi:MAG TPA: hypothetical protein DDY20_10080 [Desulfobulbaceae bacterium]|nr:hypothetical protein [Desulfobulbaceae bacterium]
MFSSGDLLCRFSRFFGIVTQRIFSRDIPQENEFDDFTKIPRPPRSAEFSCPEAYGLFAASVWIFLPCL